MTKGRAPGKGFFGISPGFLKWCNELLISSLSRYVSAQSQVAHNSITAASNSSDMLMHENERLRKELEVYTEKAARLQKVKTWCMEWRNNIVFLFFFICYSSALVCVCQ